MAFEVNGSCQQQDPRSHKETALAAEEFKCFGVLFAGDGRTEQEINMWIGR